MTRGSSEWGEAGEKSVGVTRLNRRGRVAWEHHAKFPEEIVKSRRRKPVNSNKAEM